MQASTIVILVQVSHISKGIFRKNEVGLHAGIWYIWGVINPYVPRQGGRTWSVLDRSRVCYPSSNASEAVALFIRYCSVDDCGEAKKRFPAGPQKIPEKLPGKVGREVSFADFSTKGGT